MSMGRNQILMREAKKALKREKTLKPQHDGANFPSIQRQNQKNLENFETTP